jgi:hypothetical protein
LLDRQGCREASLDSTVLSRRQADRRRHLCAAQATIQPSVVQLTEDGCRDSPTSSCTRIDRSFATAHGSR